MKLGEFRKLTQSLPDNSVIWISGDNEVKAWRMPVSVEIVDTQLLYRQGEEVPQEKQVEVRLKS